MKVFLVAAALLIVGFDTTAYASHSWGNYHWARTANPFTLKLGDNVSPAWDAHLDAASIDWSNSLILDTVIAQGATNPKNCRAVNGRVEVCSNKYGNNGWLGIASIWINGSHITQGTVKLNDTYFNTAKYNTPAWRQLVTCQEIGHTIGLDHQDEIFANTNLGTCMDYTNAPAGGVVSGFDYGLSNESPNAHDYEQLTTVYTHLDSLTTLLSRTFSSGAAKATDAIDTSNSAEWGKAIRTSSDGRNSLYERNVSNGHKIFTFVIWAN